jgi:hypothetical protein
MEEEKFFIRIAVEPLWKDRGAPQTEYRTHERYTQLYMQDGIYNVGVGNERGLLNNWQFSNRTDADGKFDEYVNECGMNEDLWKTVQEENSKLTLKQVIECYFKPGDFLREGMDAWLDRIKKEAHVPYCYHNLYSNSSGFLAKVKMWRRAKSPQNGEPFTDKVEIFIENNGLGHMVLHMESI